MELGGSSGNGVFIKRSLTGAILTMFLMAAFLSLFLPSYGGESMEEELDSLTQGYYDMTGSSPVSEEVWALSGIYTPYGKDKNGGDSTAWGTTSDGWVYGARIVNYSPSQLDNLNSGKEDYTVQYDDETGLYYYIQRGADLEDSITAGDPDDPKSGTLYTAVTMDEQHRSSIFFTSGGKQQSEDGTWYNFTGYRYVWQPLRDYKASNDLDVDKTTTSLSMVWYAYPGTDGGLSSQLMLCGSDSGLSYITTKEITESFNSSTFASKLTMIFNGIDMYVHIKLNPYAIQFGGLSPAEAFSYGYWSIMVTSPSVTTDTGGFTLQAFSPDRLAEIVFNLLTFSMDGYGLSGVASTLCSLFFTVGFYTSLIAICLEHVHLLILMTALVGVLQGIAIFT